MKILNNFLHTTHVSSQVEVVAVESCFRKPSTYVLYLMQQNKFHTPTQGNKIYGRVA